MEHIALFPGSFNPFTKGHQSIVSRSLTIFDTIIIAIGVNGDKDIESIDKRMDSIRQLYVDDPRVIITNYETLTADIVKKFNANCIIRGIRNGKDLEYETNIAEVNYSFFGVETIFMLSEPNLKEVSSSVVRELQKYDKDVSSYLPTK
ncbi:MAG: pantetheine-phosphate adenylyltransferase [Bacteroidia bacterium]|nr:pantetheine-phosphate adenylyltransferase [Bacteroidia bacterium]